MTSDQNDTPQRLLRKICDNTDGISGGGPGSGAVWGRITGNLTDQTDLVAYINDKLGQGSFQDFANPYIGANYIYPQVYGQSLSIGANSGGVITTTQPFHNKSFNNGPIATGSGSRNSIAPLIEVSDETVCSALGNYLTERIANQNGIDPTVWPLMNFVATAGVGGQTISALSKGGSFYPTMLAQMAAVTSLAGAEGHTITVPSLIWIQGESDQDGSRDYKTPLLQLFSDFKLDAKSTTAQTYDPTLVMYQTNFGLNLGNDNVTLAQYQVQRDTQGAYIASPIYHLLNQYTPDNEHLLAPGYNLLGQYIARAVEKSTLNRTGWKCLSPRSWWLQGKILVIDFYVQSAPLVFDTTLFPSMTDKGFSVYDASGKITLSDVSIVSPTRIQITLSRTIGASPRFRYGLDYSNVGGVAGGNLRDSSPDISASCVIKANLYNWCVAFEETITLPSLAGLIYDFDSRFGIALNGSNNVTTWAPAFGAAHNLSAVASQEPGLTANWSNSRPALDFSITQRTIGATALAGFSSGSPFTLVFVGQQGATLSGVIRPSYACPTGSSAADHEWLGSNGVGTAYAYYAGTGNAINGPNVVQDQKTVIVVSMAPGVAGGFVMANGVTGATDTPVAQVDSEMWLGGSPANALTAFQGKIARFQIYNRAISQAEATSLTTSLRSEYGF